MTKKKNRFLTFIFSFLPGAGEMYMGFMKMGVSLMGIFFLVFAMISFLAIDFMVFVEVIVWFYSFFHVHNLASLPDEAFAQVKDAYILPFPDPDKAGINLTNKYRKVIAVFLIIMGVFLLGKTFLYMLADFLPQEVNTLLREIIGYYLPRMLTGAAIIILGIHMIRGKKRQLENEGKGRDFNEITENRPQ